MTMTTTEHVQLSLVAAQQAARLASADLATVQQEQPDVDTDEQGWIAWERDVTLAATSVRMAARRLAAARLAVRRL